MKKFLPFVFPVIALLIVAFLAFRWYNSRTVRGEAKTGGINEGVRIEDLTQEEMNRLNAQGTAGKDLKTLKLEGKDVTGQVRYELKDGQVQFTVNAALPDLEQGKYQIVIQSVKLLF
jgi:hypothetical protein